MSKAHRGKGTVEFKYRGRGTCPICKRTNIKAVYDQEVNEKKITVCKQCKAALAHGKMQDAVAAL